MEEKNKVLDEWVALLEEADSKRQWGQVVEAAQHYTRYSIIYCSFSIPNL